VSSLSTKDAALFYLTISITANLSSQAQQVYSDPGRRTTRYIGTCISSYFFIRYVLINLRMNGTY
jgi:hypothetical protein